MSWSMIPLGKVAPAKPSSHRFPADQVVWHLTLDQIESGTGRVIEKKLMPSSEAGSSTYVFDDGNVLYSKLRPYLNKVVCPESPGIATTELVPLRPNEELIDRRYLAYYLRSERFLAFAINAVAGVKMPRIIMEKLWDHEVPLPLLSEQRRIIEILDQANSLRHKCTEGSAKAAHILPAIFYDLFGDPIALLNADNSVPLAKLEVDLQNGFACGEKDVEDGVPHLRMNNIDDKGLLNLELLRTVPLGRDTDRYRLKERDVLFMGTNSEDKIGKTCLFLPPDERSYLFSNHLIRLRVADPRITPEYLAAFLHLLWSKKFFPSISKRWVNQASVAQSSLVSLRIPLPDERSLQVFTSAYRKQLSLSSQRVRLGQSIAQIFSVLLHRAFAGDLTARWHHAHADELLHEAEEQAEALATASAGKSAGPRRGRPRKAASC